MGRYAFFNTGLEYKFAFGIQDSEDIETFGGFTVHQADDPEQMWSDMDKPMILEELADILDFHADNTDIREFLEDPKFKHSVEGTNLMWSEVAKRFKTVISSEPVYYRFRLGCIIYHQLLYKPKDLRAVYEL
jgi:hypothetical protein